MKKLIVVVLIALLSIASVSANGVDDQGQPNDPATNERANACYEGGSMEDAGCSTDWEWTCGWHLIRWEADGSYEMPSTCRVLLPSVPVVVNNVMVSMPAGCTISNPDVYFNNDSEEDQPFVTMSAGLYINSCGDVMTATIQTTTNSYEIFPNSYACDTSGSPYELRVIWSSVSGSYTEFWTGDCIEVLT